MKNFGTIIDNFDTVTKQYVDNKVPTDEHIKGIKVDDATLADTAKKVQNSFTYKAHNKAAGTVVPITYDGSEAASLDFSADDFAPVYTSGKDLGLKLVDKGYATKTYVDSQDALKLDKAGGSITGNLTVGGNLTINGTTTTVDSTTLQVKDKLIEVAHGNTATLTTPAGLVAPKYDGTNSGALVFDSTGTAYVGDVTLKDGNIDVANSDLQPLATRTGLVGGNLVQYDSSAQTLKDSGKKISDLALKKDIPTNYVTTDTNQGIFGKKWFVNSGGSTLVIQSSEIDLNTPPTSTSSQYNFTEFTDKSDNRMGIVGSMISPDGYAGIYLQARNAASMGIKANASGEVYSWTHTPADNNDSDQIATTEWVRENYQATCYAGRDSGETDTRYFKVASYSTVADYDNVTLVAHLQDIDSHVFSTVNIHCSTGTKASVPSAFISVTDNITYDASKFPFDYYKDRLFVVANYTIGTQGVTFELWLKTTDKYQQTIFKVISQSSRKGTSKKRPWTLYNNVTTASGTTDFSETSSDGRLVVNNNYLYGATVGYLQPQTNNNIDLGSSDRRWNNGYITNLQLCKVINGGGGNSMIQQKGDTSGSDITVGSTNCALKIIGKYGRPEYKQGKNGTYVNLALQSDITIPFDSNDLSTGTYRSTKLPSGHSLIYIEDRERRLSGYFYKPSGAMEFQELYFVTNFYTTLTDAKTNLTIYKLKINGTQVEKTYKNLFVSSNGSVEVGTEYAENGTFYYKVLK